MKLVTVLLAKIHPPRYRLRDDIGDLEELKASMKQKGLLEPIVIRAIGADKYEVVAGQRRYLSALEIGWTEVEVRIIEATDQEAFELALMENLQRKSMDVLEEGVAFHAYVHKYGYGSAQELAKMIGKSPSYVSGRLSIVDTSEDIKQLVREKKLGVSAAEEVSRANTENSTRIAELASDIGLTPKQIRSAVNFSNSGMDADQAVQTALQYPDYDSSKTHETFNPIAVAREHLVLTLQRALKDLDDNIHRLPEKKQPRDALSEQDRWIQEIRAPLHELIDLAMHLEKEYSR